MLTLKIVAAKLGKFQVLNSKSEVCFGSSKVFNSEYEAKLFSWAHLEFKENIVFEIPNHQSNLLQYVEYRIRTKKGFSLKKVDDFGRTHWELVVQNRILTIILDTDEPMYVKRYTDVEYSNLIAEAVRDIEHFTEIVDWCELG